LEAVEEENNEHKRELMRLKEELEFSVEFRKDVSQLLPMDALKQVRLRLGSRVEGVGLRF
jgi:hypothetical protein